MIKNLAKLFAVIAVAVASVFSGSNAQTVRPTPTPVPYGFRQTPTPVTPTPVGGIGTFGSGTPSPSPTPFHRHIGVGAWVNPSSANPTPSSIASLETYIGRTLDYSMHYDNFVASFPSSAESADGAAGRVAIISMSCGNLANIISGAEDGVLSTYASQVAAYGHPVEFRWCWEMNLSYRNVTASQFVMAWHHMHSLMASTATNMRWYWCPGRASNAMDYYPGTAYVDDAGWDSYDTTGVGFANTMSGMYGTLSSISKPFIVGETGAFASKNQSSYLTALTVAIINAQFPKITAVSVFDANGTNYDYTLSGAGLASFKAFALAAQ